MVAAAFVAPFVGMATARFVECVAALPDVRLGLVTCDPLERIPPSLRERLAGHWRIGDPLDPRQLAEGVVGVGRQMGRVDRLVGVLEQLQVPMAEVREALGIEGMDVATAHNVRDKARMKTVLRQAGIPCAEHALVSRPEEARAFADQVGYPLVAKPPAGAGSQSTYRLDGRDSLEGWLAAVPPSAEDPGLLEEFLTGEEHTFDSVTVGGTTRWSSIADYRPPPLEVLRNPWIQWTVLLPRDISGPEYRTIHEVGPAALQALGVRDALTHMEWFRRPDGTVAVSEVAARPPGQQLTSMHGYSHDVDLFRVWSELMVLGSFERPERRFASGTAYLRGLGKGRVRTVHGLEQVQREIGGLVVEARVPEPGQPAGSDYLGEGYVIVRDPDTAVVQDALDRLVHGVRVELVESM